MSSEKFCLKWNDFQDNIQTSFRGFRDDADLCDVTFVCEDGHSIDANKMIISASSPILRDIMKIKKHSHPLIYMKGVSDKNMKYIIDFMYYGEVSIFQEELEGFVNLALELKLKGLQRSSVGENDINPFIDEDFSTKEIVQIKGQSPKMEPYENIYKTEDSHFDINKKMVPAIKNKISMENIDLVELDEKIKSMTEKRMNSWVCRICGKETDQYQPMSFHIEAKHITGMKHPCSICGRTYRSRNSLNSHTSQAHSKIVRGKNSK